MSIFKDQYTVNLGRNTDGFIGRLVLLLAFAEDRIVLFKPA